MTATGIATGATVRTGGAATGAGTIVTPAATGAAAGGRTRATTGTVIASPIAPPIACRAIMRPMAGTRGYRRFGIGVTLSSALFGQDYWIGYLFADRLPEPYGPYRWVRYYDDALLVDVYTGRVVDVVYGMFW
ncbi:RcnB family protein [Sphingomonas sp. MMS24-JH45]